MRFHSWNHSQMQVPSLNSGEHYVCPDSEQCSPLSCADSPACNMSHTSPDFAASPPSNTTDIQCIYHVTSPRTLHIFAFHCQRRYLSSTCSEELLLNIHGNKTRRVPPQWNCFQSRWRPTRHVISLHHFFWLYCTARCFIRIFTHLYMSQSYGYQWLRMFGHCFADLYIVEKLNSTRL